MKTAYDILTVDSGKLTRVETTPDLITARIRVDQMAQQSPKTYFIYCPKTGSVVDEFRPKISPAGEPTPGRLTNRTNYVNP